jgi:hemerythrin-like metal-binding protein
MADSFVMTTFQWTADYAVGVRQIDEEHQRLFALAEEMHRAMLEGEGKAILQALLAGLVAYTSYHFAHEEQLM